jgi:ABC-type dipeptide/oligopeptide/nickel transport system permease subunit
VNAQVLPAAVPSGRVRPARRATLIVALAILGGVVLMAVIGPLLVGASPLQVHLAHANQPPSARHPFGTDVLGRDVFARTWAGARISLGIGLAAVALDLGVGVVYGGVAGYLGGTVDQVMARVIDVLYGVPFLLVAMALLVVRGPGPVSVVLAIALVNWLGMARLVRGEVQRLRDRDYVLAARALGVSGPRVLFRHLLPQVWGPVLAWLSYSLPQAIFAEAFLSFIGLGVRPPLASWGSLISFAAPTFLLDPYPLLFPAAALVLTLLACYLLGDCLRPGHPPGG